MPEIENAAAGTGDSSENAMLGKYEVGKLLGCGAFAKVHHARDTRTGQSVAIKIISKNKILTNNLISSIKREISIMSRLHHPHIVKLHEVLATKTKIFFVMDYLKGGELFCKVAKGRFSEDLCRRYFHQLISAVGYCHSRGVYHRDLKLENLLVDENGDLKVSDFGLSAVTGQIRQDGLLHTLCGTPAYVAPEVLAKIGYDGAKVDVWSCGIILFVMCAGYLPFNDPNLMVMYKKIQMGEFRFPKWISVDLQRFLTRLMDPNPDTRITVYEILHDPWFQQDYKPLVMVQDEELNTIADFSNSSLNAFDLISFSSGLNLSCLFTDSAVDGDRLLSSESPEKLMDKVEKVARTENIRLRRRKELLRASMEGLNSNFGMSLQIYRLTESLSVVEVRRTAGSVELYTEMWTKKVRPELNRQMVAGN